MKRISVYIVLMMFCLPVMAQQDYFIFIQDVLRQPFYVRMGEKSFSSSAGGHVLLSGMKDSVYSLYVGFPRNLYPEQLFTVTVDKKDRGFELKNMGGDWQLFDLQRLELLKAEVLSDQGSANLSAVKKTDSYSALLAGVVDDSAVLYTSVTKPVAAVPEAVVKKDTVTVKPVSSAPVTAAISGGPIYDKRDIIRFSSENQLAGKEIIYLDRSAAVTDTIRILIPRL